MICNREPSDQYDQHAGTESLRAADLDTKFEGQENILMRERKEEDGETMKTQNNTRKGEWVKEHCSTYIFSYNQNNKSVISSTTPTFL